MNTQELERMHEGLSRTACAVQVDAGYSAEWDPTPVPPGLLMKLKRLVHRRGYHFSYEDMGRGLLGLTQRDGLGGPIAIRLRPGMSEASQTRVLIHEIGHTYVDPHAPTDIGEMIVESAAALVTGVLRCTDGRFSAQHVGQYSGQNPHALASIRPHAVKLAQVILNEIGARQ